MPSWEETLGFFAGSTVRLLRSHAACEPGDLLVTLQASSDSAEIPLMHGPRLPVSSACQVPYFMILALCYDPSPTACLTMHSKPCHSVLICIV